MTETSRIANNVAISKQVSDLWDFLDSESLVFKNEQRFWECFCQEYDTRFPVEIPPGTVQPMTDEDAKAFEHKFMKFGQHMGSMIGKIPLEYLLWLDDQEDFRHELKRYLASERMQREQD